MKVLFVDKYTYIGKVGDKYSFINNHGEIILLWKAKLVDREKDTVIMFLGVHETDDIQYSFETQRKLGQFIPHEITLRDEGALELNSQAAGE